jgi:hypothetical protein
MAYAQNMTQRVPKVSKTSSISNPVYDGMRRGMRSSFKSRIACIADVEHIVDGQGNTIKLLSWIHVALPFPSMVRVSIRMVCYDSRDDFERTLQGRHID